MHKPIEPESLRQGSTQGAKAPCNCTCVKGSEPGTEQPQSSQATVYTVVYATING